MTAKPAYLRNFLQSAGDSARVEMSAFGRRRLAVVLKRVRHLWTALVMLVMALVQFSGVEHLCLCGSCAVSKILTGAEPEHACCAKLRQSPGWHDEGSCDCGDHSPHHPDAELAPDATAQHLATPPGAVATPQPQALLLVQSAAQSQVVRARAPPDPDTPTYLLTLSLRI